jgi:hypothetical protein
MSKNNTKTTAKEGIVRVTDDNRLIVIEALIEAINSGALDGTKEQVRLTLTKSANVYLQARANYFGVTTDSIIQN